MKYISEVLFKIILLTKKRIFKNTIWATLGFGLRTVIKAIYFIIIARSLGPDQFGAFSSTVALISIFMPFSYWGSGNILIKYVTKNQKYFGDYWGSGQITILICGSFFILTGTVLWLLFFKDVFSIMLLLCIAFSDLIFALFVELGCHSFLAFDLMKDTILLQNFQSLTRLFFAIIFFILPFQASGENWGILYLCGNIVSAVFTILYVNEKLGKGKFSLHPMLAEFKEGFLFSVGISSQTIYNDIDKSMLSKFSTLSATGIYSAAYRIIDVMFTPVKALLFAAYSRFFSKSSQGKTGSYNWAKQLVPGAALYGLFSVVVIYFFSFLMPVILGEEYLETSTALIYLSPIILLKSLHYFPGDALTGSGHQGARSIIQVIVALINIILNLILIPKYGYQGAIITSLISDSLLVIFFWSFAKHYSNPHILTSRYG